ncbi:MAG: hypothetical protein CR988_04380 [Treponema sp.]|nr:MAG: hypothetical protein CR988_04380 [Treponema sp.]
MLLKKKIIDLTTQHFSLLNPSFALNLFGLFDVFDLPFFCRRPAFLIILNAKKDNGELKIRLNKKAFIFRCSYFHHAV